MQKFNGFPPGSKLSPTAFPAQFFSELMPMIDDLGEMKVTLFCFWALHQKTGRFRYLSRREFSENAVLLDGLRAAYPDSEGEKVLGDALQRAVERGTLLCAEVALDTSRETLYFVNSELGRTAVEQIQSGQWYPSTESPYHIEILPERPNIYRLYEQYIGMITPRIADYLKDAEKDYPVGWVEEAIYLAVESQKCNWRYIQGILKRWEKEGKGGESTGRQHKQNEKKGARKKYNDFIIS